MASVIKQSNRPQFYNKSIGINRFRTNASKPWEALANAADSLAVNAFETLAEEQKELGISSGKTVDLTILDENGRPKNLSAPANLGRLASKYHTAYANERYSTNINNVLLNKIKETKAKYPYDQKAATEYFSTFASSLADSSGADFKGVITDIATPLLASMKIDIQISAAKKYTVEQTILSEETSELDIENIAEIVETNPETAEIFYNNTIKRHEIAFNAGYMSEDKKEEQDKKATITLVNGNISSIINKTTNPEQRHILTEVITNNDSSRIKELPKELQEEALYIKQFVNNDIRKAVRTEIATRSGTKNNLYNINLAQTNKKIADNNKLREEYNAAWKRQRVANAKAITDAKKISNDKAKAEFYNQGRKIGAEYENGTNVEILKTSINKIKEELINLPKDQQNSVIITQVTELYKEELNKLDEDYLTTRDNKGLISLDQRNRYAKMLRDGALSSTFQLMYNDLGFDKDNSDLKRKELKILLEGNRDPKNETEKTFKKIINEIYPDNLKEVLSTSTWKTLNFSQAEINKNITKAKDEYEKIRNTILNGGDPIEELKKFKASGFAKYLDKSEQEKLDFNFAQRMSILKVLDEVDDYNAADLNNLSLLIKGSNIPSNVKNKAKLETLANRIRINEGELYNQDYSELLKELSFVESARRQSEESQNKIIKQEQIASDILTFNIDPNVSNKDYQNEVDRIYTDPRIYLGTDQISQDAGKTLETFGSTKIINSLAMIVDGDVSNTSDEDLNVLMNIFQKFNGLQREDRYVEDIWRTKGFLKENQIAHLMGMIMLKNLDPSLNTWAATTDAMREALKPNKIDITTKKTTLFDSGLLAVGSNKLLQIASGVYKDDGRTPVRSIGSYNNKTARINVAQQNFLDEYTTITEYWIDKKIPAEQIQKTLANIWETQYNIESSFILDLDRGEPVSNLKDSTFVTSAPLEKYLSKEDSKWFKSEMERSLNENGYTLSNDGREGFERVAIYPQLGAFSKYQSYVAVSLENNSFTPVTFDQGSSKTFVPRWTTVSSELLEFQKTNTENINKEKANEIANLKLTRRTEFTNLLMMGLAESGKVGNFESLTYEKIKQYNDAGMYTGMFKGMNIGKFFPDLSGDKQREKNKKVIEN